MRARPPSPRSSFSMRGQSKQVVPSKPVVIVAPPLLTGWRWNASAASRFHPLSCSSPIAIASSIFSTPLVTATSLKTPTACSLQLTPSSWCSTLQKVSSPRLSSCLKCVARRTCLSSPSSISTTDPDATRWNCLMKWNNKLVCAPHRQHGPSVSRVTSAV